MPDQFSTPSTCLSCKANDRRQFIQNAAAAVAGLLGLSALHATVAASEMLTPAMPLTPERGSTSYAIPAADGVSIDVKNEVILARANNIIYAFALACPHQNTALRWLQKDHRFQCPKHKSKYSAAGEFQSGRATRNMDRLPIVLEGTSVTVDTSREIRSDQDAAKWAAAFARVPV